MNTIKIEGTLRALSPIHHGGDEKTGSGVMIRRMKFLVNDEITEIPVISGNGIRGSLRRKIFQHFCECIGYEPSIKMFYTLFSGGILEEVGGSKGHIDLELREKLRNLVPPASLLGFSILNQIIAGKLQVGHATPICEELNEFHSPGNQSSLSFYEILDDSFHTRRDDLRVSREEGDSAIQMLYTFETLATGSRFQHSFVLQDASELECSCLRHMIDLWVENPILGGKSATGFGQVDINYQWSEGFPDSSVYLKFLEVNRKTIIELLLRLQQQFTIEKTKKELAKKGAKKRAKHKKKAKRLPEA